MSYFHSPRLPDEGKEFYFKTCSPLMNTNCCLFTGGTKWPSLPSVGQTGHHQRATRVSSSCVWRLASLWLVYLLPLCDRVSVCLCLCVCVCVRFQKDPTWSETGDRYLLKLFRDHLFHQVTEAGMPWIDLSHIVSCLNKVSQLSSFFPLSFIYLMNIQKSELSSVMKSSMQSGIYFQNICSCFVSTG